MKIGKNFKLGDQIVPQNAKYKDDKVEIVIGDDVTFGKNFNINVTERLIIGDRSIFGDNVIIEGRDITIGREFWCGNNAHIGGGSCFEKSSKLVIGDQCHLGDYGMINTARAVSIGDEVGMGIETKIFTHGAYLNYFDGFPVEFGPVKIESRVWLPNAIVMPNVTIGHDTVVGAGAVVTNNLPSGCLAVGTPAKAIKENCYPKKYSDAEFLEMFNKFKRHFKEDISDIEIVIINRNVFINGCGTLFDFKEMRIDGQVTELTEKFRNELRRWGCRFKYYPKDESGMYVQW